LREKLGGIAPVLGNAYYYDAAVAKLVDGPGRATAGWLDRVVDTLIIDGAVNGVGSLVALLSRGIQQLQDGRVRRYALAITVGVAAGLLYVVIWLGR
jgi:NADH-quinone oxidoreductase subunit L